MMKFFTNKKIWEKVILALIFVMPFSYTHLNTINVVKKHLNKEIQIEGALLTMYDIRTNLSNQVVKEVKKYFDNKVYKTVIPRNVRLSEAPSYGMPITEYDPRSKGAKSYMKFAKECMKINEEDKKAKHMA